MGGDADEWCRSVGERSIRLGYERKLRGKDSVKGRDSVRVRVSLVQLFVKVHNEKVEFC